MCNLAAIGSPASRAAFLVLMLAASPPLWAQSGLQYSIIKDQNGNIVGELSGNGVSIDLADVPQTDLTMVLRNDIPIDSSAVTGVTLYSGRVWSQCADGTVIMSPTVCASTNPAKGVVGVEGTDVAVTGADVLYVIAREGPSGSADKYIYRFDRAASGALPGGALRIATGANGTPYVINSANNIFRWTGSAWQTLPGAAKDIGANANGVVWVIGMDGIPYRWDAAINNWRQGTGGGTNIAVAPDGNPWLVNAAGQIFRFTGSAWQQLPGSASDIAVAGDGTAYVVGGGGQVYRMAAGATNWTAIPGAIGTRVSAGSSGMVYSKVAVVPMAPTSLAARGTDATGTTLTWGSVAGARGYTVKMSKISGGPYTVLGNASSTSFLVDNLTKSTLYYFVVSAKGADGESPNSAQLTVKTTSFLM